MTRLAAGRISPREQRGPEREERTEEEREAIGKRLERRRNERISKRERKRTMVHTHQSPSP